MLRSLLAVAGMVGALSGSVQAQDRSDAEVAYRAATGLLHRELPEQAAAEYRSFLRAHPEHPKAIAARYGLAVCLTRLQQWQEAGRELDAVTEARDFEFAPDALLLRAQCALATDDAKTAQEALSRLLKEHGEYEHADAAAAMLGESLYRSGRAEEAAKSLGRVSEKWPKSESRPRAELFLALIDADQGRDTPAATRLSILRDQWPKSEVAAQAALIEAQCRHRLALTSGSKPDAAEADKAARLYQIAAESGEERLVPDALLGRGQLARARGDAPQAARFLDDVLGRFPSSSAAAPAKLERARVHLDQNQPGPALALLEPLVDAEGPSAAEAAYWAAKCDLKESRWDAAASRLERASNEHEDSPLLPEMLFDRAVALSHAGKNGPARRAYAQMRTKFPKHALAPEALAAEASLASAEGDQQESNVLCEEFLTAEPGHARAAAVELLRAENTLLLGQVKEAADLFAAFLRQHPEDSQAPRAALRRGLALAKLGQTDEAAAVLQPVLAGKGDLDPALRSAAAIVLADHAIAHTDWAGAERWLKESAARDAGATLKLGIAAARQGRAEEAMKLFDQVARENPDDPAAIQADFERAQLLVDAGSLDDARMAFERVLASEKKGEARFSVHAMRHLASIASRQNRPADAAKLLAQVAEQGGDAAADATYEQGASLLAAADFPGAEAALRKFLEAAPSHARAADARAQRSIAVSRQGRYDDALGLIEEARSHAEEMRPDVRASFMYEHAWVLGELNRPADAARAYEELLKTDAPQRLLAHGALDLAQLRIAAGEHAAALPLLQQARGAKLDAGESGSIVEPAEYLQGLCELKLDKAPHALATLERFLKDHPESELATSARLVAGQAALKVGKHEAAAAYLEEVVKSAPPDSTLEPALLCLGQAHAALQNWDKSRAAFESYLAKFENAESWFQARFGIGWALENQGRHAEAIAVYRDVVSRHEGPTAARAQFQVGECLFALKKHDEAVRELLKVDILYAYPEWSAAALYEAGRCLLELHKPEEARRQFTAVTERFKDTQWAELATRQLAQTRTEPTPGGDSR